MKLKIKKYLKLSLCLLAPILLGASIAPILTSCSEVDYDYSVYASENDVKNINGTSALVVPKPKINKETIYMYWIDDYEHGNLPPFSEIYLPIINKLYFKIYNYQYRDDITSLKWYDGYQNGLPKEVNPKDYQFAELSLDISETRISGTLNLPKVSHLEKLDCWRSSCIESIDLTGVIKINSITVAYCQLLTSIIFDENAVLNYDFFTGYGSVFSNTNLHGTLKFPKFSRYPVKIPTNRFTGNRFLEKVCLYGDESMYETERGAFDSHIIIEYYK